MDATNLLFYLPCDSDLTDLCGNTWSTEGSVSVDDRSLNFTGEGYVYTDPPTLGANDFTFSWWEFIPSLIDTMLADTICIDGATGNAPHALGVHFPSSAYPYLYLGKGTGGSSWVLDKKRIGNKIRGEWVHRAIVRSGDVIYAFENGALYASFPFSYSIDVSTSLLSIGGLKRATRRFAGLIKEFQFYNVALWTEDFTPPTDDDYFALAIALNGSAELEFSADVRRKVKNSDMTWRYENEGVDWKLLVDEETGNYYGVTLENLPESQSRTGTAFYQYSHEKCFDLPSTSEVWIKFDVYFDGSNRWRAYNGGANGTTGITAQTTTELSFFSNGSHVQQIASGTVATNQLQTVLLHMVSGSSDGVIEAWIDEDFLYRYEGDVNHGEVFADIYLQSDGNGTFFSNVIISNEELTFADGFQVISFDLERNVEKTVEISFDTQRRVKNVVDIEILADVEIKDVLPVELAADVIRRVTLPLGLSADVEIFDVIPVEVIADVNRAILTELALYATDNSEFFSGGSSTTIVIPSLEVMPPAENNSDGLQSVEISIAEQQFTDQVKVSGTIPLDNDLPVRGQYLDYCYDMRTENVTNRGELYIAHCCTSIDEILNAPLNYDLTAEEFAIDGQSAATQKLYPLASEHVKKIADALGLEPVMLFDDFYSTVEVDSQIETGASCEDLLNDIFGWSWRIPTQVIHTFIKAKKLYVVQRGHEEHLIDITAVKKSVPTVARKKIRTYSQRKKFASTEVCEILFTATTNPVKKSRGDNPQSEYSYDDDGLLKKSVTTATTSIGEEIRTVTTYDYGKIDYDSQIHFLPSERRATVLVSATTKKYVNDEPDETTMTTYTPLRQGLSHCVKTDEDGDIIGECVGQNTSDDRVTPYSKSKLIDVSSKPKLNGTTAINMQFPIQNISQENLDAADTAKGNGRLYQIVKDVESLNGKTAENINVLIYNYPHVIDFNDRIILDGKKYFLVSNTARTTPRIFNEQNLSLVRWT